MADLGSRANLDTAINTLLDDAQPNEAIQPSDHNTLLKNALDTVANGLPNTLRTNPETGGQDLEITSGDNIDFKNSGFVGALTSGTLTGNQTYTLPDNTGTVALLSDIGGKFGITSSGGIYTFYDTIELALASASSGDVIEQFTNVTVTGTTTINLIDGVTWNMNGYTYKNNDAGQCAMFTIPTNTTVKFTFKNGTIIRDGGTYSGANNGVVQSGNYYDSEVICDKTVFEASTGFPFYGNAKVVGGTFKGQYFYAQGCCVGIYVSTTNGSAVAGSNARIYNSYFYASNNYHYPTNGCLSYNSTFESDGSYGAYLGNGNSEAHNCTFISSASQGLRMLGDNATQYSRAFNCVGISSAGYGIYMSGHAKAYNCGALALAGHGAGVFGYSEMNNCSTESKAGIGLLSGNDTTIKNCSITSQYDNTAGHALEFFGGYSANGFVAVGNHLKVTNAGAFCLKVSASNDGKWSGNTYEGATTAESITNANLMSNTPDTYNNVKI